jgi:hypothetical protein
MASQWFVRGGGKVYGPLDDARLRRLVQEGKINESTEVSKEAAGPWYSAGKVRGLFHSPAAPVSPAPRVDPIASNTTALPAPTSVTPPPSQIASGEQPASDAQPVASPLCVQRGPSIGTAAVWKTGAIAAGLIAILGVAAAAISMLGITIGARPRLQGSVFIVKASGESVRLGLTDIYVVPSAAVTDELVAAIKESLKGLRSAEHSIDYYSRPSRLDRAFSSPAAAQRNKDEKTFDAIEKRSATLGRLAEMRGMLVKAALDQTKTDADGEFEMPLPASASTSIVAYATRKIDAHSEHYFWIIPSDEALKQKPRIFLSNDNQLR